MVEDRSEPDKRGTTSGLLQNDAERRISFRITEFGARMFTIDAEIADFPEVEWDADGANIQVAFTVDELDINLRPGQNGDPKITLTLPRSVAYFLWGNIDQALVAELYRFQRTGKPSPLLEEVRQAMGIDSDDH